MAEGIMVLAVLFAPLAAVQVSVYLARRREARERQLLVFKTLMATRASALDRDHVQALNMIDIEFYGRDRKAREVLEAWKAYLDHLNSGGQNMDVWGSKREDFFVELLYRMAQYLGYEFDKTYIRRTSYFPKGYGDMDWDQLLIRRGLAAIFEGKTGFPVTVYSPQEPGNGRPDEIEPRRVNHSSPSP